MTDYAALRARDEEEFERRAQRAKTKLNSPSPLLRRVRQRFIDSGGSPDAFDWALADYARSAANMLAERDAEKARADRAEAAIREALAFPADDIKYDGGTLGARMRRILSAALEQNTQPNGSESN